MIDRIRWLGHASFCIEDSPRIMIDPWRVVDTGTPPDVILVSHEHYDHCSPADVNKLIGPNTRVIASRTAAEHLDCEATVLRPWQVINIGRACIKAVPAYTFNGEHPAHRDDLGFVISLNYTDIYYAGDTDFIPELRGIHCDIAILPAGKRGLMPPKDAADFVRNAGAKYVIPSHIGNTMESARRMNVQVFERILGDLVTIVNPTSTDFAASR